MGGRGELNLEVIRIVEIDAVARHARSEAGLLQLCFGNTHVIVLHRITIMVHPRLLTPEERQEAVVEREKTTVVTAVASDPESEMPNVEVTGPGDVRDPQGKVIETDRLE
jgi:hypothetical protein